MANEQTPKQASVEQIRSAETILLLTHEHPDGDALGSLLGLRHFLESIGKTVTAVTQGDVPKGLSYLPGYSGLESKLEVTKDLLIIFDETQAKVGNINLRRLSENKLAVVVTPKGGLLTASNLRIEESTYPFDLIICLDTASEQRLGEVFMTSRDIFYEVPTLSIDHHSSNAHFAKVNYVDVTASSTAEMLVSIIESLSPENTKAIDEDTATCLLTGIISDTGSFQNAATTPKSLTVAAQLVASGARQQEIVSKMRERPLSTLRLWGRALSYLKEDVSRRFAWSALSRADFVAAQAEPGEASGVIDELIKTASDTDFVLLLSERGTTVHGSLRSTTPKRDVSTIAALFGGGGHVQAAAFSIEDATLATKEQEVLSEILRHVDAA